jgi:hypothetical protein
LGIKKLKKISGVDSENPKFVLPRLPDPNFRVYPNAHHEQGRHGTEAYISSLAELLQGKPEEVTLRGLQAFE